MNFDPIEMWENKTQRVEQRIVSLSQPHIRPSNDGEVKGFSVSSPNLQERAIALRPHPPAIAVLNPKIDRPPKPQ